MIQLKNIPETPMNTKPPATASGAPVEPDRKDEPLAASASPLRLRQILVPIDFSECSKRALQYAMALGGPFEASVTLLHVAQIASPGYEFGATDFPKMEAIIRQRALTVLAGGSGEPGRASVPIRVSVRPGWPFTAGKRPSHEIIRAAKEWAADLIIIGTHGRTGIDHLLLGSTTDRVVRGAPCPVLVVHEHESINAGTPRNLPKPSARRGDGSAESLES